MPGGVDAIYRLNVTYIVAGQNCLFSIFARSKPGDPLPNHLAVCDKFISDWEIRIMSRFKAMVTTSTQIIAAVAQCLNPPFTAQAVKNYVAEFGANPGDTLPPYCAAVLSLYTQFPGRRTHGRMYISGIPESFQNAGVMDATSVGNLNQLGGNLVNEFGQNGTSPNYWWGVYSRKNGNGLSSTIPPFITYSPLALIPWTRYNANSRLGTQRHRVIGRGI